jgi:hypothetical protein
METVCDKGSDTDSLIQEIYRLHNLIAEQGKIEFEIAIKLGELLTLQKSRLEHGRWQEWTKRYLPDFSASTLCRYMLIYEHRREVCEAHRSNDQ